MNEKLEKLRQEIATSVQGLSAAQTQLRPQARPAAWSIQEILEHLLLTYDLAGKGFEDRLAKRRASLRQLTAKDRFFQWLVIDLGYFPAGRIAPGSVTPGQLNLPAMTGAELAEQAAQRLAAFDSLTARVEIIFGKRRSVYHSVLGLMSAPQWRTFQLVHGRHHLKQVARIRADHKM